MRRFVFRDFDIVLVPFTRRMLFVLLVTLAFSFSNSRGEEFRIDTEVFDVESDQSVDRHLTLFEGNLVYDFRLDPNRSAIESIHEITIFDRRGQRFILLDVDRKIQMELDRAQLIKMVEALRSEVLQSESIRFLADVSFEERQDVAGGEVVAESEFIQYIVRGGHPRNGALLPAYHEFLDHYTMLSATDPTSFPPFARMKFNQIIKKYGWIPAEIELTITAHGALHHDIRARSEHQLTESLAGSDRERIALAKRYWMEFRRSNLAEYRGLSAAEAARRQRLK